MAFYFSTLYLCYLMVFVPLLKLTAGLSLYEKVQLLETNYGEIKENLECKILNLEKKVSILEAKIIELVETKERQDSQIERQNLQINILQNEWKNVSSKLVPNSLKINELIETIERQDSQIERQNLQINILQNEWKNASSILVPNSFKINELVENIERQDSQIERQNLQINILQNEWKNASSILVSHSLEINDRQKGGNNNIFRTCHEINEVNPLLGSGIHWIDPDGKGIGDDPIYVYCNMTSGSTSIFHDLRESTDVGHCAERGCYSRKVNYNATTRQISALIGLSEECLQSISYDCISAPFQFNGVEFSWWNDRNGEPKYFWSGNDSKNHICQCGIDQNCVESHAMCNCDSVFQKPLNDSGVITDKNILPITRLNFGRTMLNSSSGVYTLGPLECTGKVNVKPLPSSCEDLWRIGHIFSGFHSVMGDKNMEIVYCDFSKSPDQQKFQTWIGYSNVKSFPTYFFVQKNSSFNKTKIPIPFEIEQLNTGGAMDLPSGKFTAPRMGTYFFSFTGVVNFPAALITSRVALSIGLYSKGKRISLGYVEKANTDVQFSPVTLQSTLNLQKGDQIWLQITAMSAGVYLFDSNYYYTHFTGWLLEEEVFSL